MNDVVIPFTRELEIALEILFWGVKEVNYCDNSLADQQHWQNFYTPYIRNLGLRAIHPYSYDRIEKIYEELGQFSIHYFLCEFPDPTIVYFTEERIENIPASWANSFIPILSIGECE